MAHLEPPIASHVERDPEDKPELTKIFAAFIVGEHGETTVTPFGLRSTTREAQIREMAALVDQWARSLKTFIHEYPERLGL